MLPVPGTFPVLSSCSRAAPLGRSPSPLAASSPLAAPGSLGRTLVLSATPQSFGRLGSLSRSMVHWSFLVPLAAPWSLALGPFAQLGHFAVSLSFLQHSSPGSQALSSQARCRSSRCSRHRHRCGAVWASMAAQQAMCWVLHASLAHISFCCYLHNVWCHQGKTKTCTPHCWWNGTLSSTIIGLNRLDGSLALTLTLLSLQHWQCSDTLSCGPYLALALGDSPRLLQALLLILT